MIKFREFITEYSTVGVAKNLNLKYIGFGRYKAHNGKLYIVKNKTLVPFVQTGGFDHPLLRAGKGVNLWGASHGYSHKITGAAANTMGIPGYDNTDTLNAKLWKKVGDTFLKAINESPGSSESLFHGFADREHHEWSEGETVELPPLAASGSQEDSAGYGMRLDPKDQEGHPVVFEFPKGTPMAGYSRWSKEDAKTFGHVWSEAIVAGRFRVKGSRNVKHYTGQEYKVVQLEPIGVFDPSNNRWRSIKRRDDSDKYQDAGTNDPSDGNGARPWDHYLKLDKAQEVANHLKFDPDNVFIKDGDSEFEVAGQKYHLAGSAHLAEGTIDIYPNNVSLESLPGTMAHEVMHHKWHKVYTTYVQEMETFRRYQRMDTKPSLKSYPTYAAIRPFMNTEIADKLREEDGATKYSDSYWKQYEASPTMEGLQSALHETLAELARLDYETKGTYFDRVIRLRKGPWRKFYDAVNKSYERLTKNDN